MDFRTRNRPLNQESPLILVDGVLCRLEVWSDERWLAERGERCPVRSAYVPGLGRVVAVPLPRADVPPIHPIGKTRARLEGCRLLPASRRVGEV